MSRTLALFGLLAVLSTAAFAEMEIVVTASRVEEETRTEPAYVRIIPEDVVQRGDTVLDALRTLPDVAVLEPSAGKEYVSMGAFGENGFARTLIMIDGRPVNRPDMATINWRTIPLGRVERIEVVKGPLSSQYGDQAIAGAVNIITSEPQDFEAWMRTNLTTGLTNRQAGGVAWTDGTYRAEAGVSREDLRPSRDRSDSLVLSANLSLGAELGAVDLELSGEFSDAEYQLPSGLTEAQYDADPDQAIPQTDEVAERRFGAGIGTEWTTGPISWSVPVSWKHLESEYNQDSGFGSWYDSILDDIRGTVQGSFDTVLGDAVGLTSTSGIDVGYSQINVQIYGERARTTLTDDNTPHRLDLGLWTRADVFVGESWVLDGGARASYYDVVMGSEGTRMFPVVYDLGASWLPSDMWKSSLRYGRVFRYPSLDEQASYYGFGAASLNEDLKPEYGHHLTASGEWTDGPFSVSIAPYFLAMTDEIGWDGSKNANIGDTYHYGAAVSAAWSIDVLGLRAAYSFDEGRFADTGKVIPLVPSHTVTGGASFRPLDWLEFSSDVEYRGAYYEGGDAANALDKIPGRTTWDARIDWTPIDDLSIYAQVLNILNDRTPSYVYYSSWYPADARSFDFGAAWRY